MVAIEEVMKQSVTNDPSFKTKTLDYGRYLVLSLGTGTKKQQPRCDAKMAGKWGVLGWLVTNGSAPLIEAFMQSSTDLVGFHENIVFESLNSVNNCVRIQDDTLIGDVASTNIATMKNLNNLVRVGKRLLDSSVSRVNCSTGVVKPIPNGGTNREVLKRFAKNLSDEQKLRASKSMVG